METLATKQEVDNSLLIAALEESCVGTFLLRLEDPDDVGSFRFLYVNPIADAFSSSKLTSCIGLTLRESHPDVLDTHLPYNYAAALRDQKEYYLGKFDYGDRTVPFSSFTICAKPLTHDTIAVYFTSTTEKKSLHAQLKDLSEAQNLHLAQATKQLRLAIEKRKRTEAQILDLQAQLERQTRITILGEMSTALAHEINQPLSAILSYTHGCRKQIEGQNRDKEFYIAAIDRIEQQANRVAGIIGRIRDFLQPASIRKSPVNISSIIYETLDLMRPRARSQGALLQAQPYTETEPLITYADSVCLTQVFVNLINNAIESYQTLPRKKKHVRISYEKHDNNILVDFEDWGCGLPKKNQEQLFDYFFTTKKHGLGMGLSISQSILERHQGKMEIFSKETDGTIVRVILPIDDNNS